MNNYYWVDFKDGDCVMVEKMTYSALGIGVIRCWLYNRTFKVDVVAADKSEACRLARVAIKQSQVSAVNS